MHNLLCNRYSLSKWKRDIDKYCVLCHDSIENNEHLIISCENVREICKKASVCLTFSVSWKTIVIGFYDEVIDKTVAYRTYKYKMFCRIQNKAESYSGIRKHIQFSVLNHYFVLSKTTYTQIVALFKRMSDIL